MKRKTVTRCRAGEFLKEPCRKHKGNFWVWDPGDGRRVMLCTEHRDLLVRINNWHWLRNPYIINQDRDEILWLKDRINLFKRQITPVTYRIGRNVVVRDMEWDTSLGFSHIVYRLSDGKSVRVVDRENLSLKAVADILNGGPTAAVRYVGWEPKPVKKGKHWTGGASPKDIETVKGLVEEALR